MAVTLRSYGDSGGADSTSCVITKPAGLEVGDLMVAQVGGRGSEYEYTAPEGWASIREDTFNYWTSALFWKIADAADAAASDFTFTTGNSTSNRGTITAWYGHNAAAPINANNGQGQTSETITAPTITPSVANCVICLFCGYRDNYTTSGYAIAADNPASWTEAYDLPSDLELDLGLALGYAARPETSGTGNGTATLSSAQSNTGQLVAIAPIVDTTVTPTTLALTTTSYVPLILIPTILTPSTLALNITTYAPEIGKTWMVTPSTATLTLTEYAPILKETVTPSVLELSLTTYAPTVTIPLWYHTQVDWNNDGDFDDTYEDITPDIKTIHFSRGKSDELGKAEVGQLSITVNNADGKYTPSNSDGVLYNSLLPKRPIKVRAVYEGTTYNLFYGYIEEIIPHPHLTEQDCIITAVDGLDFLSKQQLATALWKDELTGTLVTNILDATGWSDTLRTIDAGQDTVPYGYWHNVSARYALGQIEGSEQGFIYVNGAGYFNFEDRHHRSTVTHQTSQTTFDNTMTNMAYSLNPKNVYNIVKATVTPWEVQSIAELWRLQETPSIPAGETYTWWGDASVGGIPVFVDAWTTPASTTDYTANSQADGLGTNMTSDIVLTATKFAKTIKLALENTGTIPAYITLLKARGTYYDDQTKVTRTAEDTTSQTAYQKRTLAIKAEYITDADKAQDLCDYAIGKFKDPRAELSMSLVNQDATTLIQILSREVSDRITIVNDELGITDSDYFIDHMEHDISMGGKSHTATYQLADTINEDFWCLDYSKLDTQTKLGY